MTPDASDERLVEVFSTHWVKYVRPTFTFAIFFAASIVIFVFAGVTAEENPDFSNAAFLIALGIMLVSFHWFFFRVLSEGMIDVLITSRRVIFLKTSLLFRDEMQEITLPSIRSVEAFKRGLFQNIFRYGSLWFDTGGSEFSKGRYIGPVGHPQRKAKNIMQVMDMK